MISATSMLSLASSTALLLSIGALSAAVLSLRRYRSTSAAKLSQRLTDLEETVESLSLQLRNLRSRANMQALRERRASHTTDSTPTTTTPAAGDVSNGADPAAVRAALNAQLAARGRI